MNITSPYLEKADPELLFFRSLKSEMHPFPTRKIISIVRTVLTSIVDTLPTTQVAEVVNQLPSTLQLIFVGSWKANRQHRSIVHIDELVENMCKDEMKRDALFSNEVEALKHVLIVIKNLKIFFDKAGLHVFPYSMISEYQQAVQEGAA